MTCTMGGGTTSTATMLLVNFSFEFNVYFGCTFRVCHRKLQTHSVYLSSSVAHVRGEVYLGAVQ